MRLRTDREPNEFLPKVYTCEGMEKFPEFHLDDVPLVAKGLALLVEDPDAPGGTRDHLLVANIPIEGNRMDITLTSFAEAVMGCNSRGELARGAPCPPQGIHRYVFSVYAINCPLTLSTGFSKQALLGAMQGHILAEVAIVGLYQKGK